MNPVSLADIKAHATTRGLEEHRAACPSCFSSDIEVFYRTPNIPVNSCILFKNQAEAREYPRGELELGFCRTCGFISNLRFDSKMARYTDAYEEQQSFSPRFNAFAKDLATGVIERNKLRDKQVVEIGCGKGDFLLLLCELGMSRGIGIDPTYIPERSQSPAADRVTFIRDFYSERYSHLTGDMVCCRHTLEHIPDTANFLQTVRRSIGEKTDTIVFFELPDVERVLRECAFWDIYYEHCSYFTLGSLARLFRRCGFEVTSLAKEYDGQYLLLEALPVNGNPGKPLPEEESLNDLAEAVAQFRKNYQQTVSFWKQKIETAQKKGQRVVLWGSGSKCVSFLSNVGIKDEIEFAVDINPYRHGKFLPGSGKPIAAPSVLTEYRPDLVIAMNPIYLDEIRKDLNSMGLNPELTAV